MPCILRVSGDQLDIDFLLQKVGLEPDRVWYKGEPKFKSSPEGRKVPTSGASFYVSGAGMDEFKVQVEEATSFVTENIADIQVLASGAGVDEIALDFGIERRNTFIHSDYLPASFIKISGEARIGIELSHYPCSEDES